MNSQANQASFPVKRILPDSTTASGLPLVAILPLSQSSTCLLGRAPATVSAQNLPTHSPFCQTTGGGTREGEAGEGIDREQVQALR